VAKAQAAAAAARSAARSRHIRLVARRILEGTANPDSKGLLLHGREYQPSVRSDFDPLVLDGLIRLARLAGTVADALRECPDAKVRRSAAVVAARAHPIRAAFDD
jgi:hypothetical protein